MRLSLGTVDPLGESIARKAFKIFDELRVDIFPLPKTGVNIGECQFFIEFAPTSTDFNWISVVYPSEDGGQSEFPMIICLEGYDQNVALGLSVEELNFLAFRKNSSIS